MRARELLEDYNQHLDSDLNNLLVAAKGNGLQEIQTQDIVDQLYGMGYSINANSLIPLLSNNPIVMNVTPEMISLTSPEGTDAGGAEEGENSEDKVSDMAMQTAEKGLKDNG